MVSSLRRGWKARGNEISILVSTLDALGITDRVIRETVQHIIASARPEDEAMSKVYEHLNADLQQAVQRKPVHIRHITGEARVLVDPAHRNVIAANHAKGLPTRIACRQHPNKIIDAYTFISAQKTRWAGLTWVDLIDIISLCARGSVWIFVLKQAAPVHYSLFGGSRALIQEPHDHPSERKNIWYVESPSLISELADRTNQTFDDSYLIPPSSFDAMLQWLFSEDIYRLVGSATPPHGLVQELPSDDIRRLIDLGIMEPTTKAETETAPLIEDLAPRIDPDLTEYARVYEEFVATQA